MCWRSTSTPGKSPAHGWQIRRQAARCAATQDDLPAVIRIVLLLQEVKVSSIMPFAINATFATLVVLGIMVLVHEFGHFITAKAFGVRVEVFSIGFGKRLFGFKRGDTDYRISLVPLGGYVKMSGETAGDGVPMAKDAVVD